MKRLFLLFCLLPFISSAQPRHGGTIDTGKADTAQNLSSIAGLSGHGGCARAADIRISKNATDSGEYVTTVVFFHFTTALDSAGFDTLEGVPYLPAVRLTMAKIELGPAGPLAGIPPLPVIRADELPDIAIHAPVDIKFDAIPMGKADTAACSLRLPVAVADELDDLPLHRVQMLAMEHVPAARLEVVAIPSVVMPDEIEGVPLHAVTTIHSEDIPVGRLQLVTEIPQLPIVIADEIPDLPLLPAVRIRTEAIVLVKAEIILMPPKKEEVRMPVDEMHLSPDGYSLLEKLEGYSPELYSLNDGGFTIGFGFFVPYGEGAKWSNGVTWEEAEIMIKKKVPVYEDQVKQYINVPLTQNEFDALTMLAYNLGGFSKATSIVNDVNDQVEFEKLQKDWKRYVHSKAPGVTRGLMNRRNDELEVRKVSNYQPLRKILILMNRK